ncbi:DUF436 family protein, partial [Staphylococcus epidermidis]|uniref:DUF436 family protein n=1 Tax=Staphylococcus epidermidis TaxID=1282 RepID=UPI0037D9D0BF
MPYLQQLLHQFKHISFFNPPQISIIPSSTSQLIPKPIRSLPSIHLPKQIYQNFKQLHIHTPLTFPFQPSQHINTPLTIQTPNFNPFTIQQLTLLPHLHPPPTLSTYPYQQIQHPIVVE